MFGHIYEAYGAEKVGDVLHVNACICDAQYRPDQPPFDFIRRLVATT